MDEKNETLNMEGDAINILLMGKKGSGKSVTGWSIVQTQHLTSGRPAYVYRCPKPELLKKVPFQIKNLTRLSQLFHLRDSVCLIDEANIHFDVKSKQINDDLKELLQLSRQNNTTFIFVVHNSYVFNRGLFGHLDVKIIKELTEDHWELERPHMKRLYHGVRVAGKENMYVDSDEFRGYAKTEMLDWYDEEFSCMYRVSERPKILFAQKVPVTAKKCEQVRKSAKRKKENDES